MMIDWLILAAAALAAVGAYGRRPTEPTAAVTAIVAAVLLGAATATVPRPPPAPLEIPAVLLPAPTKGPAQ